jgi:hypothetical protein
LKNDIFEAFSVKQAKTSKKYRCYLKLNLYYDSLV